MKKIISGGTGEFTDKKSRFIANIYHIEDEDMAVKIIEQLRKKYWDARHNCFAFIIGRKSFIYHSPPFKILNQFQFLF